MKAKQSNNVAKEKIKLPERIPCPGHRSPCKDCKECKKINRKRKNDYLQKLIWQAGTIIFKHWPEYLDKEKKKHKSLAAAVEAAKKSMHELCPWENTSATAQRVWLETLNEAARQMHDSVVVVIKNKKDIIERW